jgi:hypothetical protein
MADTLSTYTSLVQVEVDDTSTNATSLIQQYIKETYQEVVRAAARFLVAPTTTDTVVTIGDGTYTPTTEWMELYGAFYALQGTSTYNRLKEITKEEWLDNWVNAANGTPVKFVQDGLGIRVVPSPNDAGTLRLVTFDVLAELTTQDSIIPTRYQNVIKYGAAYRYKAFDDNPAAVEFEGYYRKALQDMMLELSTKVRPRSPKFFGK